PRNYSSRPIKIALRNLEEELEELYHLGWRITHVIEEERSSRARDSDALLGGQKHGASIVAIPPQLNFVAQPVTTESASQVLTVFNVGNTPTTIPKSGLFFSGTNQKDFKIIVPDSFPNSLPSQSTLTVAVAFAPTADGGETRTATLNVP